MKINKYLFAVSLIYLLAVCQVSAADEEGYSGVVAETLDTGPYTYVLMDTGSEKIWFAGPAADIKVGDSIKITSVMPMPKYYSKSLDREFEMLYFVTSLTGEEQSEGEVALDLSIMKAEGGKTITEIMDQQQQLAGQVVSVRGQVIKYNRNILDNNWIHIRDSSGEQDLTITTKESVALGDVIVAVGKIGLNRDFGYGYVYDVMLEDAKITVEKQ